MLTHTNISLYEIIGNFIQTVLKYQNKRVLHENVLSCCALPRGRKQIVSTFYVSKHKF